MAIQHLIALPRTAVPNTCYPTAKCIGENLNWTFTSAPGTTEATHRSVSVSRRESTRYLVIPSRPMTFIRAEGQLPRPVKRNEINRAACIGRISDYGGKRFLSILQHCAKWLLALSFLACLAAWSMSEDASFRDSGSP
jgi:hypothetical protein